MAAPIPSFIQLPVDTSNTGKKPRTQTRQVGANVVHEHFFVPVSQRAKKSYHYSMPLQSVQASAQDATTTGFFWLQNPAASAIDLAIRKVFITFGTTNVASVTVPRIVLARFTFTGTPSGAVVTPARRLTGDGANAADMRTAVTGMTVTPGATFATFIVPQMHAAGQAFTAPPQEWPGSDPFEDNDGILVPGEGVLLYQPDAGTASDPRRFVVNLRAEEVER